MQSKVLYRILFFLVVLPLQILSQVDTSLLLPEMEVKVFKVRYAAIGASMQVWDSSFVEEHKFNSLGDFLQQNGDVYIKTYSGNSLATMSVRGSSAAQTLVLWNGLPIQSAMLGQLDLALLPLNFSDRLSLEKGGNSSAWGSGAIGGVLSMDNEVNLNTKIAVNYHSSLASFGNINQQLRLKLGSNKFQTDTRLFFQKGKNDIVYRADPSLPLERQEHAAFAQMGLMQSFYLNVKQRHKLAFHAWLQESNKELPPTLTQSVSEAFQRDQFYRFNLSWNYAKAKNVFAINTGYFIEKQRFEDPQIDLIANNDFNTLQGEFSFVHSLNTRNTLEICNTNSLTRAQSAAYEGEEHLFRTAILGAYKYEKEKLALQFSLREELVNGKLLLPTGLLALQVNLLENLIFKTKITRDYRLPTLNDLYWSPGGNPDLKAEQGWSEELGLQYVKTWKKHQLQWSQTFYNRNIQDWILWAPSSTSFYWASNNIAKVWSWGSESKLVYKYQSEGWNLRYHLGALYNASTYRVNLSLPRINKGDQLLYTPKYQVNNAIKVHKGLLAVEYQHQFFGKSNGANDEIPAYHIANIQCSYQFKYKQTSGLLFFNLNNIYNQRYVIVERRPMPGINYQIGININFNK